MTDAKSIPANFLDQLQRLSHPACLVDVPAFVVIWANEGARRALELGDLGSGNADQGRAGWRLDRSSPALDQLAALQQTDGPTDAAGCSSTNEILAFRTATGVKRFACRCRMLSEIGPGLVLITAAAASTDIDLPPAIAASDAGDRLHPLQQDAVTEEGSGHSSWLEQSRRAEAAPRQRQSIDLADGTDKPAEEAIKPGNITPRRQTRAACSATGNNEDRARRKTQLPQDMATLQEIARRINEDRRDDQLEYGSRYRPEFQTDFGAAGAGLGTGNDADGTASTAGASSTKPDAALPPRKQRAIIVATDRDEVIAARQRRASDVAGDGVSGSTEIAVAAAAGDSGAATDAMAELAHELRTPISAIHTAAAIMAQERFGPIGNARYKSYAQDIEHSAAHALEVITGMLDPESLRTGRPNLQFTQVDLDVLVKNTLAAMAPLAEKQNLELSGKLAGDLPHVIADARAVKQMLLNLLANAVKFTGPGGRITVTTSFKLNGPVRIEVRDNGPGMSRQQIAGIMNGGDAGLPQQRAGEPRRCGEGLGLGLPLTLSLALANNAELHLISGGDDNTDAGLRATIVFPKDRTLPAW